MDLVEKYDIPVVTEEYLDALNNNGGAKKLLPQFAIASWGGNRESGKSKGAKRKHEEALFNETAKKSKLTVKGGAVVDPDSGLEDTHHILSFNSSVYAAVLGLVDLTRGSNSYYKLQILEPDDPKKEKVLLLLIPFMGKSWNNHWRK